MLTVCCGCVPVVCGRRESAEEAVQMEAQTMPAMQMAFGSIFPGLGRVPKPLLERRALAASNMPIGIATPLPMAGYGSSGRSPARRGAAHAERDAGAGARIRYAVRAP